MQIRLLKRGNENQVAALSHLFDGPATEGATRRFLNEPGHLLLVAYEEEIPQD